MYNIKAQHTNIYSTMNNVTEHSTAYSSVH